MERLKTNELKIILDNLEDRYINIVGWVDDKELKELNSVINKLECIIKEREDKTC